MRFLMCPSVNFVRVQIERGASELAADIVCNAPSVLPGVLDEAKRPIPDIKRAVWRCTAASPKPTFGSASSAT